ncbi:MAG: LysR family transcriptional regulator [Rhodospirillales bacterium]|nr:LysR family transcriptional regulator [Rhodospirillales bacterium]
MDAADLRVFAAVAECGTMSRAAAALHTVQSNVTARIRALEADLGCRLFDRRAGGTELTEAGKRLLPYAHGIARLFADAAAAARDDGTPSGKLAIGALETTTALRLAPLLAGYVRAWPEVDLSLRPGTTTELIAAVREGGIDGAFVCGPIADPDLRTRPMLREELAVLAAPGARSLEALLAAPEIRAVVLRAGCSYRMRLEAVLARRGIPAPRIMEFGTLEAIFACVHAGLGITLMPRALLGGVCPAERVAALALPRAEAMVETVFVSRRDRRETSALAAFLAMAERDFAPARAA